MARLVRSYIARLQADDPTLKEDLWVISDLLRKAWSQGSGSGLDAIASDEISPEEALELRQALLDAFYRAKNKTDWRRELLANAVFQFTWNCSAEGLS
jgi:hypothetical protein